MPDRSIPTRMRSAAALVVLLVAAAATARAGTVQAPPGSPNIVLILADDLGWGDVGFNGRTDWTTPQLDRLATCGTVFKRWYTGAVTCAPSRGVLMTGKYTIHNGVTANNDDLPAAEVTLAEALKAHGYATGLFGKWHHGKPPAGATTYVHPMDQGFDEFFGFTDAIHAWQKFPKELWDGRTMKPVSGHSDDLFTDRAIDFVQRHKDHPFFLYVPYITSHFNIEAPTEEVALHRGHFSEKDPARPLNATYAAMVTRLDKNVGRLLAALHAQGLTDRTLVIFTSDHGATFEAGNQGTSNAHDSNRPFRGQKRTLWEGGIRVPAIVSWPGHVPAGITSREIVHMADVFPSVLAAVGAKPEPAWKVDGANLLETWTGRASAPERTLFWEWRSEGTHQTAAMRGPLKLVITGGDRPELFDVEVDLTERRNIIAEINVDHPETVRALQAELKAWLATESRH
jgi:arylsulfatase A-like enzyme